MIKVLRKNHFIIASIILFCLYIGRAASFSAQAAVTAVDVMTANTFVSSSNTSLPYRLYLPTDYNSSKSYPMLLFLHGAGERGSDNEKQVNVRIINTIINDASLSRDCIIIAPQCPSGKRWVNSDWASDGGRYTQDSLTITAELAAVRELVDNIRNRYSVDDSRLYISGLSMGGYGTWDMITRYPHLFAAAIPVCGGTDSSKAPLIAGMPIWTFHSTDDATVSVAGTQAMVAALKSNGSNVIYTEYTDKGHGCWVAAYSTSGLYTWLFAQSNANFSGNQAKASATPASSTTSRTRNVSKSSSTASSSAGLTANHGNETSNSDTEPSASQQPGRETTGQSDVSPASTALTNETTASSTPATTDVHSGGKDGSRQWLIWVMIGLVFVTAGTVTFYCLVRNSKHSKRNSG